VLTRCKMQYTGAYIFQGSKSQCRLVIALYTLARTVSSGCTLISNQIIRFNNWLCLSSSLPFIRAVLRKLPKQTYRRPVVAKVASVIASNWISVRTLISNRRSCSCCLLRFSSVSLRPNASMSTAWKIPVASS